MNRLTKLSLLSKERKLLFDLRNPNINGEKELILLCDTISGWVIAGINTASFTNRHQIVDSGELKEYLNKLLNIEVNEESIKKIRSSKKRLFIKNNKHCKFYKQKF